MLECDHSPKSFKDVAKQKNCHRILDLLDEINNNLVRLWGYVMVFKAEIKIATQKTITVTYTNVLHNRYDLRNWFCPLSKLKYKAWKESP